MSGYSGTLKVFPEAEMSAIDMAEALCGVSTFNGILYGCRITVENNGLYMTPGWVIIGGRVGAFEVEDGATKIQIECPQPNTATEYNIVIICDLANALNPFYVDLKTDNFLHHTSTGLDVRVGRTTDAEFNAKRGVRYLTLGKVKVSTQGVPDSSTLDLSTATYPDYAYKTNKTYVDALAKTVDNRWLVFQAWNYYFQRAKHRSAFFRNGTIVGDGLVIPANSIGTFQFRKEMYYDASSQSHKVSSVLVKSGDTTPTGPTDRAYVVIQPDGTIIKQGATPAIPTSKTTYEGTSIVTSLYTENKCVGIVGVAIASASSSGTQADMCVIQSFGIGGTEDRYTVVKVRNTSSAAAKIKLSVTCLYVQNIDYPS